MPLAMAVSLAVVAVVAIVGCAAYLIDATATEADTKSDDLGNS